MSEQPQRDPQIRSHKYLTYLDEYPVPSEVSAISCHLLNYAFNMKLSASKFRKAGRFQFKWSDNKGKETSGTISFEAIVEYIKENRSFDPASFTFPPIQSQWLDSSVHISLPNQLGEDANGRGVTINLGLPFGEKFPIKPGIDRPGVAMSSFQGSILSNIARLHRNLVETSDKALEIDGLWLNNLRLLFNECVSLLDVTLHQLYFMAEYRGHELGWNFMKDKLGKRHGVRLSDKLSWIGQITKRPLDNAEKELQSFKILKEVRNHLNHFDPPCFAYTMEDIVSWLNLVPDVGRLMWKIREKLDTQISTQLIAVILLTRVEYVPPYKAHPPPEHEVGYKSCVWKNDSDSSL